MRAMMARTQSQQVLAAAAESARRELQQERDAARAELEAADQRLQAERTSSREALQSAESTQSQLRRAHDDAPPDLVR